MEEGFTKRHLKNFKDKQLFEVKPKLTNKFIIHPSFNETIKELSELKIKFPEFGSEENWDFNLSPFPQNGIVVTNVDEIKPFKLDAKKGWEFINSKYPILAYDESIQNFKALEGIAYIFSHAIILHGAIDFIPSIMVSCYFFTRSQTIAQKSEYIIESENPSIDSKQTYAIDRLKFICEAVPNNSIILIDGPLIGGQISHITVDLNRKLLEKNVIPIFIVKNSESNLITTYINELKGKFNSDMHWCYNYLKVGERTNFFSYIDQYNSNNGKIFCYLKPFDVSPQRIEVHIETFKKYHNMMNDIMNIIYYLILVQGNLKDPQVRSIAIAEKFARTSLALFNIQKLMRSIGLTATINESRLRGN